MEIWQLIQLPSFFHEKFGSWFNCQICFSFWGGLGRAAPGGPPRMKNMQLNQLHHFFHEKTMLLNQLHSFHIFYYESYFLFRNPKYITFSLNYSMEKKIRKKSWKKNLKKIRSIKLKRAFGPFCLMFWILFKSFFQLFFYFFLHRIIKAEHRSIRSNIEV